MSGVLLVFLASVNKPGILLDLRIQPLNCKAVQKYLYQYCNPNVYNLLILACVLFTIISFCVLTYNAHAHVHVYTCVYFLKLRVTTPFTCTVCTLLWQLVQLPMFPQQYITQCMLRLPSVHCTCIYTILQCTVLILLIIQHFVSTVHFRSIM